MNEILISVKKYFCISASDLKRNDAIACLLEKRVGEDRKNLNRAENEFRWLHQRSDFTREWDLNDPDYLKKDKPARYVLCRCVAQCPSALL